MKPKNTKDRETTHSENMEKARRYGIKYIDLKIDFAFKSGSSTLTLRLTLPSSLYLERMARRICC